MPFQEGKPKTGGRQKGVGNLAGAKVKAVIEDLLTDAGNIEQIKAEFKALKGRDYLKAWVDLMPYILPKLSSTSLDVDLDKLTPEQVDSLYDKIMSQINKQL